MLAQYRSGNIPGALASFTQAFGILREQLGLDPGQELVDLHRAILVRDPRLLARPKPATYAPAV